MTALKTYKLAAKYNRAAKDLPAAKPAKATLPLGTAFDHGRLLGTLGYGFIKALGLHARADVAFDADAFMAGFMAGFATFKLVPKAALRKG